MRTLYSILLLALTVSGAQAQCDSGEKIIKLGSYSDSDHLARDRGVALLRDAVNKELQGKACLEVISDEARFKGTIGISTLQNGAVHMMAPRFKTLGRFSRRYTIFDMPFAFRNTRAMEKFQKAAGATFVSSLEVSGLFPLAFWHGNFKQISAKRPVFLPKHVAGLKFKADAADSFSAQISALKATSHNIAENDYTIAAKSGKIEAQISNWNRLDQDGTAKLFDGVSETNHGFVGYQLLVSKNWWDGLDMPLKKSLRELIGRTTRQLNFETVNRMSSAKKNIMRSGVVVRALTNKQRAAWKSKLRVVYGDFWNEKDKAFMDALAASNKGL